MTKRHVTFIQLLYTNILSDIGDEMPRLRKELSRDLLRLCSALENHGLRFVTIDMVEFGKHFDKCLANRRLTPFNGTHMRPFIRGSVIPRLFKGLLMRVFENTGVLHTTCDHTAVRALRQLFYTAKKLKLECDDERTTQAVQSFFQVDGCVTNPSLDWLSDSPCFNAARDLSLSDGHAQRCHGFISEPSDEGGDAIPIPNRLLHRIQEVCDVGAGELGNFLNSDWVCKHGPGAVSERLELSKFDFPSWPKKLEGIFPLADFAFANFGLWADTVRDGEDAKRFSSWESPSKLIAVPKTQKGPRLIASEPSSHQWCQQLIKNFLADSIASTFYGKIIHLNDQSHNQRAARQASIDGSFMTIDLSEASDRVSCWVVERAFRRNPNLLRAFHAVRTRYISNDIDPNSPKLHRLRKFSTMGSALTFPVQSLLFANIALGCLLYEDGRKASARVLRELAEKVLVFGDDIIVPTHLGHNILGVLRYLGFQVNRSKTFWKGNFRESCGGDYFEGHDVTPTYSLTYPVRQRPESVVSCVATRNNFFRNGYARTAQYLKSAIVAEAGLLLPSLPSESGLLSWETHGETSIVGLRCRFDTFTHRACVRVHSLVSRVPTLPERGISHVLQYFTEAPPPTSRWKGGVRGRPKLNLRLRWVPLR